ncbi:MAG: hypothetical protein EFT35_01185 [Methanophagales archaeon ANME-1-THS]|nr:MAG: hypothetical protein EFT35_01185 [Methanophagales archaeon ANME-1-THS]
MRTYQELDAKAKEMDMYADWGKASLSEEEKRVADEMRKDRELLGMTKDLSEEEFMRKLKERTDEDIRREKKLWKRHKNLQGEIYQQYEDLVNEIGVSYDYFFGWVEGLEWVLAGEEKEGDKKGMPTEEEVKKELKEQRENYEEEKKNHDKRWDTVVEPHTGHIRDYFDGFREAMQWAQGELE